MQKKRVNADTAIKNIRQTIKLSSPRFRQLIFSLVRLVAHNETPTADKKILFDFVPPYHIVPKYKALQAKSPALAGRVGQEISNEHLLVRGMVTEARICFEQGAAI